MCFKCILKGDDDVCMCKVNGASNMVEHYYNYNQGKSSSLVDADNPSAGFSNIKVSLNNGVLNCSFTRVKKAQTINNFFDLNNPFYVLFATGPISNSIYFFLIINI